MVQSAPQLLTVDVTTRYGEHNRYELIDGELIEMEPTGPYKQCERTASAVINVYLTLSGKTATAILGSTS